MWKITCRVPYNISSSSPLLRPTACCSAPCIRENSSRTPAPAQPAMSVPLEQGKDGSAPPPPPPPPGSSGWGKAMVGLGVVTVAGTGLLMYDENSRLAVVEKIPATKTVFDLLDLSTKRKELPAPPASKSDKKEGYNVMLIADQSVSQMKHPPKTKATHVQNDGNKTQNEGTSPPTRKLTAVPVNLSHSKSDSAVHSKGESLITNIADDSIQFLLSGKRSPDEERDLQKARELAAKANHDYAESQRREKMRQEKERCEAEATAIMAKQRKQEEECERQRLLEEEKCQKNAELEQLLSKEISCAMECAQKAVQLNNLALEACKLHTYELRKAMDAENDSVAQQHWPLVCELRDARLERVSEAQAATAAAEKYLQAYLEYISAAKKEEMTRLNPSLNSYHKQASQIAADLSQASGMLENADSMDKVMKYYYKMLQHDKANFEQELAENIPDFKPGNKGSNLSEEELQALLVHAHQRVFQLKKTLLEQDMMQEYRKMDVLREQKETLDLEFQDRLRKELEDQKCRCADEYEQELLEKLKKQEQRMREELVRQGLAQNNHMKDMLKLQQSQLIDQFKQALEERVEFERSTFVDSLAKHIARVDALMCVLNARADVDKCLKDVRDLVSNTRFLMYTISKQDKPGCIDDQIIQISDALKRCQNETQDSKFIDTILASIPAKAAQCGVFSVSTLERRFENVFEECKKAALYPNSSNLIPSIISNLYSKVMVYSIPPRYSEESQLDRCGTKGMDAKELLIQANYFVGRRCLAAALKCMNQLEGVPRCLAQDWIDETRLFLEVQQATEALYSYAMSKGLGQIF